ncbi:MAG TPA: RimK/LysX family protein [Rhodanobacteraceae bacterium]|nr:RimK/LysX family protein [Rhodanobacteraceae bacterium]
MHGPQLIGWREWVVLPQFSPAPLRAKIDTGARSSALHVDWLEEFRRDREQWLRFGLRPRGSGGRALVGEAPALDRRRVVDSGGRGTERWFIHAELRLAGLLFEMELNLASRGALTFPLLLGRTALQSRFHVDPARSYACGRPSRKRS